MSNHIIFRGRILNTPAKVEITVESATGTETLPPVGHSASPYAWGHMDAAVGLLSFAIARQLYVHDDAVSAGIYIKTHFLARFKRNEPWQLTSDEIIDYVGKKNPKLQLADQLNRAVA